LWNLIRRSNHDASNARVRQALTSLNFARYSKVRGLLLRELPGIRRGDVDDWVREDEVKYVCANKDLSRDVDDLYKKWSPSDENEPVDMETMVDRLNSILAKYNPAWGMST
jgi:hypothetical protein